MISIFMTYLIGVFASVEFLVSFLSFILLVSLLRTASSPPPLILHYNHHLLLPSFVCFLSFLPSFFIPLVVFNLHFFFFPFCHHFPSLFTVSFPLLLTPLYPLCPFFIPSSFSSFFLLSSICFSSLPFFILVLYIFSDSFPSSSCLSRVTPPPSRVFPPSSR